MYYSKSIEECLRELSSSPSGISKEKAAQERTKLMHLQITGAKKKNIFLKFLSQFSDIMVLILLISATVSTIIGIIQGTAGEIVDAAIIFGIVIMNAIFGLVQENKAEKSMEALKKLSESESTVIRSGEAMREVSSGIVPGDIVVLEAGSIIPADCRLIESANLLVDESSLTGESFSIEKDAQAILKSDTAIGDRKNMVYKGTVVAGGRGLGLVVGIGKETEFGKIAHALENSTKELTPLQKGIKDVGKLLTFLIILMAGITFVLEWIARGQPLEAFLTAVAISVAAIPESMPAVITIIMSIGIARLAKQKAIVRRMHSVETLGCCDVICSDKTGTITQNKMTVQKVFYKGGDEKLLLDAILLCNDTMHSANGYSGDPTEVALSEYAKKKGTSKEECDLKHPRLAEKAFDSKRKMMSVLCEYEGKNRVFCKGAVDIMIDKCDRAFINGRIIPLSANIKKEIICAMDAMSDAALRVLGVAFKDAQGKSYEENSFVFLGLVGMIDPPRKEVAAAVKKCKKAGMKPVMITGDHKKTAYAIAKEIGIAASLEEVMTGAEIDNLSQEEFFEKVEKISVFARVSPENKAQIVEALKKRGHIVAMTGDGVNDAPSIKKASIGIGMGITGTDVAKEVSDMIITDDNFATIIVAVEEGRKVYKNIQKTVKFLFAANMGEILSLFLATIIFPYYTFLLPVQILFVNLITDSLPAIALGVEPPEPDIMERAPRKSHEGLFSNGVGKEIVLMGLVQTAIILLSYFIGLKFGGEKVAITMSFYTLNMIQLFFLLAARTDGSIFKSNPFKNKLMIGSLLFGFGILALIALTPFSKVLGLASLSPQLWLITIGLSASIIFVSELFKAFKIPRFSIKRKNARKIKAAK